MGWSQLPMKTISQTWCVYLLIVQNRIFTIIFKQDDPDFDITNNDSSDDSDFALEYNCKFCTQTFKYKALLNNHLKQHSSERPFVCKLCGKNYSDKYGLKSHLSTHSGSILV